MSIEKIGSYANGRPLVAPTSTTTPIPDDETAIFSSDNNHIITTFITYTGAVSSGTLRLWLYDDGVWYKGASFALTSSEGNVSLDWPIGPYRKFAFQVEAIGGGGTVGVKAVGS